MPSPGIEWLRGVSESYRDNRFVLPVGDPIISTSTHFFDHDDDVEIVGQGAVIRHESTDPFIYATRSRRWAIRGITFDGNVPAPDRLGSGARGIEACVGSVGWTITGCWFRHWQGTAVRFSTQDRLKRVEPWTTPTAPDLSQSTIANCRFTLCDTTLNTQGGGVDQLVYANNFHDRCCGPVKIDGETWGDIAGFPLPVGAIITGNQWTAQGYGQATTGTHISVEGAAGVCITGNVLADSVNADGIKITYGDNQGPCGPVTIRGNDFIDVDQDQIIVRNDYDTLGAIVIQSNLFQKAGLVNPIVVVGTDTTVQSANTVVA